ncbi:hypothetical protein TVAG_366140 [Trichomonas vaginalis G3]|uniref:Uncharacterized protein n=1 Tax=Trichomonas vaginalis (strain ATCC PRA-98 / G3) TaxID=412133 RepID=A2DHQ8_TRIV3|nr:hypothetical protein TVAGG3_0303190 [Trichomonas vaginalis G3]EAY20106.1 hypothetical protein TVAG_366140 [Trichomonas vaginalis G3]KAI5528059.1 hypothetical protein TVAGG3_0303190 [Trichomonas vaginalis G3]|eukprot:XP_001581092.1 hypothetical protein [Trichomonas vaginalis G3]
MIENLKRGNATPRMQQNKNRIMQSSIFGDAPEEKPTQNYNYQPPQNPLQQYSPKQYDYSRPKASNYSPQYRQSQNQSASFPSTQPLNIPSFKGLVQPSRIPDLSPFPVVSVNPISLNDTYDFSMKPKSGLRATSKSLQFKPSVELKNMRDHMSQDLRTFSNRFNSLELNAPVELNMADFKGTSSATQSKSTLPPLSKSLNTTLRKPLDKNVMESVSNEYAMQKGTFGFSTKSEFIMPNDYRY